MVKGIHHDQASQMCTLQFGQWLAVQCGHMVKGIHHDQASRMCRVWSVVNSPIWSYGQIIQHDQASLMCTL